MKRRLLPGALMQLSLGGCFYSLVLMARLRDAAAGGLYPLILLPLGLVSYGINVWLLRRSRPASLLGAVNAVLFLGAGAAAILTGGVDDFGEGIFAAMFLVLSVGSGLRFALKTPELNAFLLCVDGSAVLLVVLLAYVSGSGANARYLMPMAVSVIGALLGAVLLRTEEATRRGWGAVALAVGLGGALIPGFLALAAPAGRGVLAVWKALLSVGKLLLRVLARIAEWLASLLPELELEEAVPEMSPAAITEWEELSFQSAATTVFAVVLGCLGLALLIFLLCRLSRIRIGGRASVRSAPAERKRMSLREGLRRARERRRERARLRRYLRQHREEPYALFYRIERMARQTPLHRRREETPEVFLKRLGACADDETLHTALTELISPVNAALFSPRREEQPLPGSGELCRGVRKLLWQQLRPGKNG